MTPEAYITAVGQCQTANEIRRLHIDLEKQLTPREFAAIVRLEGEAQIGKRSARWIGRLTGLCPDLRAAPQAFVRRELSEHLTLYEDNSVPARDKRLLVGFTGNAARLMLPAPVILQHLSSQGWDVALVRKGAGRFYADGIAGVASDMPGVAAYLAAVLRPERYRSAKTFGTSGGGYAALAAAQLLGADRGVSVCGALPEDPKDVLAGEGETGMQSAGDRFVLAYGEDRAIDVAAALAMQAVVGGTLCPVGGVSTHNALHELLVRGELAAFLAAVLGDRPKQSPGRHA